jgi:YVTN family beta-propeller protein
VVTAQQRVASLVEAVRIAEVERQPLVAATVSVVEVATDSVVATLASGGEFPIRVKFTPVGDQAWVSNARSNAVAVFEARTRKLLDTVDVGVMPIGILMEPDGRRAYVANTNGGYEHRNRLDPGGDRDRSGRPDRARFNPVRTVGSTRGAPAWGDHPWSRRAA